MQKLNRQKVRSSTALANGGSQTSVEALQEQNKALKKLNKVLQRSDAALRVELAKSEAKEIGMQPSAESSPTLRTATAGCEQIHLTANEGAFQTPRFDGLTQPEKMSMKWSVFFCPSATSPLCGQVVLTKNQLCRDSLDLLMVDPAEDKAEYTKFAREYGPDELYGSMHGAEAVWLRFKHVGHCEYHAHFNLTLPGKYHVHILHTREAYTGMWQKSPVQWPPMHYDLVLGRAGAWVTVGGRNVTDHDLARASAAYDRLGFCECNADLGKGRFVFAGASTTGIFPSASNVSTLPKERNEFSNTAQGNHFSATLEEAGDYVSEWDSNGRHIKGVATGAGKDW
jgi:hypothetical protein